MGAWPKPTYLWLSPCTAANCTTVAFISAYQPVKCAIQMQMRSVIKNVHSSRPARANLNMCKQTHTYMFVYTYIYGGNLISWDLRGRRAAGHKNNNAENEVGSEKVVKAEMRNESQRHPGPLLVSFRRRWFPQIALSHTIH